MEVEVRLLIRMGLALVLGLIIGIERGWRFQQKKEGQRTAGIRTFALISLCGALWAVLAEDINPTLLGFALLVFAVIIMSGYYQHARKTGALGLTTEIAAFITFGIGVAAVKGYIILSVAVTVVMVLLLSIKPKLHSWVKTIEPREFYSAILFLVISAVVLPLLPNRGFGPWQVLNPFEIWGMVVLIAGISYVGYYSMKYLGSERGMLFTALTGSLVSSIAVTVTLGRYTREAKNTEVLITGVLIATFAALGRMLLWVVIFNPALIKSVAVSMLPMLMMTTILGLWIWLRTEGSKPAKQFSTIRNPLQLSTAIKFGLVLALVMLLSEASRQWIGDPGIYGISVISGMVDMDSITLSLLQMGGDTLSNSTAVKGLVLVAISNTFIKGIIFAFYSGIKKALKLLVLCGIIVVTAIPGFIFS